MIKKNPEKYYVQRAFHVLSYRVCVESEVDPSFIRVADQSGSDSVKAELHTLNDLPDEEHGDAIDNLHRSREIQNES